MNQPRNQGPRTRAFTLVELLVAIFIITVLIALLVPMVMRAYRQSGQMRTRGDFQTISSAIEAYRQDFGDIPRLPVYPLSDPGRPGLPVDNTGAAALCKALIGPLNSGLDGIEAFSTSKSYLPGELVSISGIYVAVAENPASPTSTAPPDPRYWAAFDPQDGADGPGFKTDVGAAKVWGPYLDPAKMKVRGTSLIDGTGSPILYFPARPGKVNVRNPQSYVFAASSAVLTTRYITRNNIAAFQRANEASDSVAQQRIQVMLGDYSADGTLDVGEDEVDLPYVLWAAGPDALFGPQEIASQPADNAAAVGDCDDVLNTQTK